MNTELQISQPDLVQLDLLPAGHELTWSESRQRHIFTSERVQRNQERYRAICAAIAEGLGTLQIARAYACSPNTVQTIREREPQAVEREKERLARLCFRAHRLSAEAYIEAVERGFVKPHDLSIGAGIFAEKGLLFAGEATSRVEHVEVSREQVEESLRRLRSAGAIEVGSPAAGAGEVESAAAGAGEAPDGAREAESGARPELGQGATSAPDRADSGSKGQAGGLQDGLRKGDAGAIH